ncbi:MAG: glycogen-binding domain-containing protein [Desulfobacterales bacterium]
MKDYMISMFIDDELDLDEKIEFVETVHCDTVVKKETINLLQQEKMIRTPVVDRIPDLEVKTRSTPNLQFWRPVAVFMSGLATAFIIFFFTQPESIVSTVPYRFVIYQPDAEKVEITGSFISWDTIPMKKMGASGYWEIVVDLDQGEHRYSYILENGERIPDPTILTREKDDFGGENTILDLNTRV